MVVRAVLSLLLGGSLLAAPAYQGPASHQVYVALTDAKGHPLSNQIPLTFEARVNGAEAQVLSTVPATEHLAIVLVAEGMQDKWTPALRRALQTFVASVRQSNPASRIGLMLAPGWSSPTMRSVTDDAAGLEREISKFVGGNQTAPLLESILSAVKTLQTEKSTRRHIIALAASENSNHHVSAPNRVVTELRRSGTSLWALDMGWSAASLGPKEEQFLRLTAQWSGGRHQYSGPAVLEAMLTRIVDLVRSQFLVSYQLPDQSSGNPTLLIGVRMDNLTVLAPTWVSGK